MGLGGSAIKIEPTAQKERKEKKKINLVLELTFSVTSSNEDVLGPHWLAHLRQLQWTNLFCYFLVFNSFFS